MEVTRETPFKRDVCLLQLNLPQKISNICPLETTYQQKGTRKKWKKTTRAAIIQWQRQCLKNNLTKLPWPKSKTGGISRQSPSPLHHTFLLGRTRFTSQPLSALVPIIPFSRFSLVVSRFLLFGSLTAHHSALEKAVWRRQNYSYMYVGMEDIRKEYFFWQKWYIKR